MNVPPELSPEMQFLTGRPGQFAVAHVFDPPGEGLAELEALATGEIGYWRCDIADGNRLTWSDEVYDLFGLPPGMEVSREEAVACYDARCIPVLERWRSFSIRNRCGFILDVLMAPQGDGARQMRVISLPILSGDEVVGLHGLKRAI